MKGSPRRQNFITVDCTYPQALAHDLGQRVDKEGDHKQQQTTEEEHSVERALVRCLGQLHGDIGRDGAHAVEDVPIHDRGIARRHQHDHGFPDGAAEANHSGRKKCPAGPWATPP